MFPRTNCLPKLTQSTPNSKLAPMTESIAHRLPYPQFEAICDKFANEIVDNMDMDTLLQIAYDQLYDYYTKCNDLELEEEVTNHYCGDVASGNDCSKKLTM